MEEHQTRKSQSNTSKTATFSMGCFWGVEALFGSLKGVIRTRVGYTGGSTPHPTYRTMGNHIEAVQLDYDPEAISFQDLLDFFFSHHRPEREPWKRQYTAGVFFHDPEQERLAGRVLEELSGKPGKPVFTLLNPCKAFFLAEERHQKYKLQRQPRLMAEFRSRFPNFEDFIDSTAAARVNALLYGYGNRQSLLEELPGLGLSPVAQQELLSGFTSGNGLGCPV